MFAENPLEQADASLTCLHTRTHIGLDRAYCPDWTQEYKQLLEQPRQPKVGDRASILKEKPSRLYQVVSLSKGIATVKPIDGNGSSFRTPLWKLRPSCATGSDSRQTLSGQTCREETTDFYCNCLFERFLHAVKCNKRSNWAK